MDQISCDAGIDQRLAAIVVRSTNCIACLETTVRGVLNCGGAWSERLREEVSLEIPANMVINHDIFGAYLIRESKISMRFSENSLIKLEDIFAIYQDAC
ncbi:hypothetical protein [Paraburkholderia unamae]|uniref:hypothetical protein n=1 Tax=Paraburkholderia unamae TaxID=219649 RepID=UPI001C65F72D|nr:hypothetical protein [Paraburkholderia unamae]